MFIVYPLFVQVDYMVLADFKSTRSQDKHFFFYILMNDLSTVQFLIQNDPSLLLKLVVLKCLLLLAQTSVLVPSTLLNLTLTSEMTGCRGDLLLTAFTSAPQRSPSLDVKLIWWKLKCLKWHLIFSCFLTAGPHMFSCTLLLCFTINSLSETLSLLPLKWDV